MMKQGYKPYLINGGNLLIPSWCFMEVVVVECQDDNFVEPLMTMTSTMAFGIDTYKLQIIEETVMQ